MEVDGVSVDDDLQGEGELVGHRHLSSETLIPLLHCFVHFQHRLLHKHEQI